MGQRMFVAIKPSEEAVADLAAYLEPRSQHPWIDPLQWHLTLAFYGDQPAGAVPDLSEHLRAVSRSFPPLRVSLHGAGSFSGTTLLVGVAGQTAELTELMHACSLDPDERARLRARCAALPPCDGAAAIARHLEPLAAAIKPPPDPDRPTRSPPRRA